MPVEDLLESITRLDLTRAASGRGNTKRDCSSASSPPRSVVQTIDSSVISGVASTVLKKAIGRARPEQGNNPNRWFRGSCCESFPSGEVTLQASFVTPFIVHYAGEHPWVWALELLPLYDGTARLKSHAHWQTDVIAGWLLGSGVGYWTAKRDTPFSVAILPRGVTIGFSKRF
jgi:hypothetical protein